MSTASENWPVLSLHERRILGVLVEKQKTAKSPDAYPLTLNALVTGSNQKSNRDPLLNLTDTDVEETLEGCQQKGLVILIQGGRVDKWRHDLYTAWRVGKVDLAILAELLLRGPQTEGELRGRVSRMEPIEDIDALRALLKPLSERKLVVYLTPEGRRGTVVTHGFHAVKDLDNLRAKFANTPLDAESSGSGSEEAGRSGPVPTPAVPMVVGVPPERVEALERELAAVRTEAEGLRRELGEVRGVVAKLEGQLREMQKELGMEAKP